MKESDTKSIHVFERPSCRLGPSFQLLVIQRIFTFSKKIWQKEIIGRFVVRSFKKQLYHFDFFWFKSIIWFKIYLETIFKAKSLN